VNFICLPQMPAHQYSVTTVILAGGRGIRIGGDKGLQTLHGRALISWVLEAVNADSDEVLINANNAQESYAHFGYRVIADQIPDWPGPLAGLQAALSCAQTDYVMTVPCDTPFLPEDLITRLLDRQSLQASEAAVAVVGGRRQPTIALYKRSVLPKLFAYLGSGGRKVNDWLDSLRLSEVVFENVADFDNINSAEDLARARQIPVKARSGSAVNKQINGTGKLH
jgi:molybdopterin-guanine dinucleotide biosynthesis protein A